jgi:hypothetical protein
MLRIGVVIKYFDTSTYFISFLLAFYDFDNIFDSFCPNNMIFGIRVD